MNKIRLIVAREYTSRVRNRSFILSTFLTPLLFAGLIMAITYISVTNPNPGVPAVTDNMEKEMQNKTGHSAMA